MLFLSLIADADAVIYPLFNVKKMVSIGRLCLVRILLLRHWPAVRYYVYLTELFRALGNVAGQDSSASNMA